MTALTKDSSPAEVRAAWADRLEAHPERQGKQHLAPTPTTRCCLGELCDMAVEAGVIARYSTYDGLPPQSVADWAGMRYREGQYNTGSGYRTLTSDNDNRHTWPQIATTIRAEPEGLVSS